MRSTAATLLVVLLVALAGCGSSQVATTGPTDASTTDAGSATTTTTAGGETTRASTATNTATTTTTTATTTTDGSGGAEDGLPPGVNESGPTDATALWQAHVGQAYGGDGYRHVLAFSDGAGNRSTVRLRASGNASTARVAFENATWTSYAWFADGGNRSALWNESSPARSYYDNAGLGAIGPTLLVGIGEAYPKVVLDRVSLVPDGTVTRDGRELVRLRVTGTEPSDAASGLYTPSLPVEEFDSANGTVLVTREGFVASMNLTLVPSGGRDPLSVSMTTARTAPPVERPNWLETVPDLDVSVVERTDRDRAQLLAVENEGSATVAAGSTYAVGKTGIDFGNVTVDEALEPGETAYVYLDGESSYDADVRVVVGDRPTLPSDAPGFGYTSGIVVTVTDGNLTAGFGIPANETSTSVMPAPTGALV